MLLGRVAGDCPEAEVMNNAEVNANGSKSLMNARGIDMLNLRLKVILNLFLITYRITADSASRPGTSNK